MMRNVLILMFILAATVSCGNDKDTTATSASSGDAIKLKRYRVPSGMVEYKIKMYGNMGVGKVKGEGTSKLYFKDYGAVELQEEQSEQITEINMFGQKQVQKDKAHKMSKLDNGVSYSVDFKAKKIYKMQDPAMGFFKSFKKGDMSGSMEDIMKSMGAKKIGTEKVLGYPCDVWEMKGVKMWMYKGVPLKTSTQMMGITYENQAVKAEFGGKVPDKYFRLPDYPVADNPMSAVMNGFDEDFAGDDGAAMADDMDYDEFKAEMLKNTPDMPESYIKQAYEAYKQMNTH